MPIGDQQKKIAKRATWEFLPPLGLAAVWIAFQYLAPDTATKWSHSLNAIRDFSVAFFMLSWLWSQYNRIEHQTVTRDFNENLRDEVGAVKASLEEMKGLVAGLPDEPPATRPERVKRLSELVNTANNHVDVISAKVGATLDDFLSEGGGPRLRILDTKK